MWVKWCSVKSIPIYISEWMYIYHTLYKKYRFKPNEIDSLWERWGRCGLLVAILRHHWFIFTCKCLRFKLLGWFITISTTRRLLTITRFLINTIYEHWCIFCTLNSQKEKCTSDKGSCEPNESHFYSRQSRFNLWIQKLRDSAFCLVLRTNEKKIVEFVFYRRAKNLCTFCFYTNGKYHTVCLLDKWEDVVQFCYHIHNVKKKYCDVVFPQNKKKPTNICFA